MAVEVLFNGGMIEKGSPSEGTSTLFLRGDPKALFRGPILLFRAIFQEMLAGYRNNRVLRSPP
jgi:hypothetical protein